MGKSISAFLLSFIFFLFVPNAYADYIINPTPQPTSQISMNKLVQNPSTGQFVDNLNSTEFKFLPKQEVLFRLEVKNNGQTDLNNIQVKDRLPDFLDFISGPGTFDEASKTLNFNIDKLSPGESKVFDLKASVKTIDMGSICVTNFAEAKVNNLIAQDTAVICIEKKVLGEVTKLPVTGPSSLLIIIFSISLFLTSTYLNKKIKI